MRLFDWLSADRVLAVVGLLVTVLGTGVAVWQLLRTRRAAESARAASNATRATLRAADLRRALDASIEVGRRLDQTKRREQVVLYLGDWMVAYQRIHALLSRANNLPARETEALLERVEDARGEVFVAREAADHRDSWALYSRVVLRRVLVDYGATAERLLLASEDQESSRHAS